MLSAAGILRSLPYEIAYQVIQSLDRVSLKQCRLVNRQLEPLARRALFLEVHVITTVQSLQNATWIGCCPRLSPCARTFVYHASTLLSGGFRDLDAVSTGIDDRNLDTFTTAVDAVRVESRNPYRRCISTDLLQPVEGYDPVSLWQDYTTIWQARLDLEKHGYVSQRLRSLISHFPRLVTVKLQPMIVDAPYSRHEHMPGFCRSDEDAFTDLLAAIYDKSFSHISASALHWGSFRPCNDLTFMLSSLKTVELSICDTGIGFPYEHMRQDFDAFLISCRELETFSLDIGRPSRPNSGHWRAIQTACDLVLQETWHRLRSVSFTDLITSKGHLGRFFTNHKETLRRVSMKDVKIEGDYGAELEMIYLGGRWCAKSPLVAVCTTIRENCRLEYANLSGRFEAILPTEVLGWCHEAELKELEGYMCHHDTSCAAGSTETSVHT